MKETKYKHDCVFKYVFGMDCQDSVVLRKYIVHHFLGIDVLDYTIGNSEVNVIHKNDKKIFKDILMLNNDVKIGIEMEYKKGWSAFNQKRFQYYSFRNIAIELMDGSKDYDKLREFHELIFIDARNKATGKLIENFTICSRRGDTIESCLVHISVIFLKEIDRHIKGKEVISEEEALLYLMQYGTLEGIAYEDKEHIITIMEKRRKQFERNAELMNYCLTDYEEEKLRKMEIDEARSEGKFEGEKIGEERGKLEGEIETVSEQMEYKYHKIPIWLKDCTKLQLKKLKQLILQDISLEELEKIILSL